LEEASKLSVMAAGLAVKSEGEQYNGKMTRFVVLSCMVAATGGLIFGYDIGVSGPFLLTFIFIRIKEKSFLASRYFSPSYKMVATTH
jgi:hypothetical protein